MAVHAEGMVLRDFAAGPEKDFSGWVLFVTDRPCDDCYALIRKYQGLLVQWERQ